MKIKTLLKLPAILFAVVAYTRSNEKDKICGDLAALKKVGSISSVSIGGLAEALLQNRSFRNIFYFRIRDQKILKLCSSVVLKPLNSIEMGGHMVQV